jgi:hypothetical protein
MKASISDMEAIFPYFIFLVLLGGAAISGGDLFETLTMIINYYNIKNVSQSLNKYSNYVLI